MTTPEKIKREIRRKLKTSTKTTLAESFPSLFRILENLGRKDALKAPSAKIRRNVLAILRATKSASVYIDAPKQAAIIHSRRYPATLLNKVKTPTVKAALITAIFNYSIFE